jgi:EpsI family protein
VNRSLRLAAALVAAAAPALLFLVVTGRGARLAPVGDGLPPQVEDWQLEADTPLEAEVLALIDPDSYAMRYYEAPGRTPVWLYVALYGGRAGYSKGAHDPEVCYPAQGWEVVRSRGIEIPVGDDGETFHATEIELAQGPLRELALYWFQPAGRWPAAPAPEQLFRVVDAIAGRPQYAFVRLSGSIESDEQRGARDLLDFARAVAPGVRAAVSRPATDLARAPAESSGDGR